MKITLAHQRRPSGFILLLVLILSACSLIILSGMMYRTSTISRLNSRNTQLSMLDNAAEAATEKIYAQMATDFENNGPGLVNSNLPTYQTYVPTITDNPFWGNIQFSDPSTGIANRTYVNLLTNYTGPLPTQYPNQFATTSPIYRIVSNATMSNSLNSGVIGTAQEDVLLALVPITTYAIFYNGVLEFSDCATMLVNGRVHSNSYICVGAGSGASLTFSNAVTCCGTLTAPERGGVNDWTLNNPSTWATSFTTPYTTNALSVNLSISMTNTHSIIDIPPAGESPMSVEGQTRLYNEAQVVIIVTNSAVGTNPTVSVTLQTGYNGADPGADATKENFAITNATQAFLNTNSTLSVPFLSATNAFYDQRQGETNLVTQIDVGQYANWLSTNTTIAGKFTGDSYPTILYVADQRHSGARQAVVRLVNASQLPYNHDYGFSVATQNPLYVQGNYNVTVTNVSGNSLALGSTTNGASVPAALLADAVTILSPQWHDNESSLSYGLRPIVTSDVTVNAALVTGAIPSTDVTATTFSGGVQNLTRFLENWTGVNLTLNTSIVNLFNSHIATNQFQMPNIYYNPPKREWGFDTTYYSPDKQPPGVPCALVPIRFNWQTPPPASVTSN